MASLGRVSLNNSQQSDSSITTSFLPALQMLLDFVKEKRNKDLYKDYLSSINDSFKSVNTQEDLVKASQNLLEQINSNEDLDPKYRDNLLRMIDINSSLKEQSMKINSLQEINKIDIENIRKYPVIYDVQKDQLVNTEEVLQEADRIDDLEAKYKFLSRYILPRLNFQPEFDVNKADLIGVTVGYHGKDGSLLRADFIDKKQLKNIGKNLYELEDPLYKNKIQINVTENIQKIRKANAAEASEKMRMYIGTFQNEVYAGNKTLTPGNRYNILIGPDYKLYTLFDENRPVPITDEKGKHLGISSIYIPSEEERPFDFKREVNILQRSFENVLKANFNLYFGQSYLTKKYQNDTDEIEEDVDSYLNSHINYKNLNEADKNEIKREAINLIGQISNAIRPNVYGNLFDFMKNSDIPIESKKFVVSFIHNQLVEYVNKNKEDKDMQYVATRFDQLAMRLMQLLDQAKEIEGYEGNGIFKIDSSYTELSLPLVPQDSQIVPQDSQRTGRYEKMLNTINKLELDAQKKILQSSESTRVPIKIKLGQ